jgi:pyruvate dehydrogenase (quinone)
MREDNAMSRRVADLLIETLHAAGVRTCYGIVGDTMNRIAHAIDKSEIDWVHMRHEEAGAFAAGAEALLTGRLTACAGTCGPVVSTSSTASMMPIATARRSS